MATLNVEKREKTGKYDAFNLRKNGRVPAVVYGKGLDKPLDVSMTLKDLQALLKTGEHMLDLAVAGDAPRKVVVKDVQHGTYDADLLHVDFRVIDENEAIQVDIPVEIHGEAAGAREGGILELETMIVTVRSLPKHLPNVIRVDVSKLGIGDMIYIDELPALEGVSYVYHGRPTIVSCRHPQREDEAAAESEGGPTQPEVMAEKASEARAAEKK